jgi:hypothetical protein
MMLSSPPHNIVVDDHYRGCIGIWEMNVKNDPNISLAANIYLHV